jgi:hypothetical protein
VLAKKSMPTNSSSISTINFEPLAQFVPGSEFFAGFSHLQKSYPMLRPGR